MTQPDDIEVMGTKKSCNMKGRPQPQQKDNIQKWAEGVDLVKAQLKPENCNPIFPKGRVPTKKTLNP